jgi:hypothetical protein
MSAEINQLKKGQFTINRKLNELSKHHDDNGRIVKEFCFGGDYSRYIVNDSEVDDDNGIKATVFIPKGDITATGTSEVVIGVVLSSTLDIQSLSFKVESIDNSLAKFPGVPVDNVILNNINNPMIISNVPPKAVFCIPKENTINVSQTQAVIKDSGEKIKTYTGTSFSLPTISKNIIVVQETTKMTIGSDPNQTVRVLREVSLSEIGLPDVEIERDGSYTTNDPDTNSTWRSAYQPLKVWECDYTISNDFTEAAVARDSEGNLNHAAGYIMKPLIGEDIQYVRTAVHGGTYDNSKVGTWYKDLVSPPA